MNIKKMNLATPAATAKTPVNPMMAAMIAIARKINAHANIMFLLYFKRNLRLVDESRRRKLRQTISSF